VRREYALGLRRFDHLRGNIHGVAFDIRIHHHQATYVKANMQSERFVGCSIRPRGKALHHARGPGSVLGRIEHAHQFVAVRFYDPALMSLDYPLERVEQFIPEHQRNFITTAGTQVRPSRHVRKQNRPDP